MIRKLVDEDKAYYCTCTPEELKKNGKEPWRKAASQIRRNLP